MDFDVDFINIISSWRCRRCNVNGDVYDAIDIVTTPHNIELTWLFKRNKSVVYDETLKDSVYFYAKSLNFMNIEAFLLSEIECKLLK